MPKQDCKYWDKCYQKNLAHLEKYNHPPSHQATDNSHTNNSNINATEDTSDHNDMDENINCEIMKENANSSSPDKYETEALRAEVLQNISGKNYLANLATRIKLSEQLEYNNLLKTNEFIRHKFFVEMPPDFYAFWNYIQELKPKTNMEDILNYIEKTYQLKLVGAFEFLAGKFENAIIREPGDYLRHWRFYYDPPEFQTIFVRKNTGVHYGYWRDTPSDKCDLLVARNDCKENCEFEFVGGNVFEAFLHYLDNDFQSNPFNVKNIAKAKKSVQEFLENSEEKVKSLSVLRKSREGKVLCKTFHRAGIVVPFDNKTKLGYRPLTVSDAELKKILKLFDVKEKDESIKTAVMEKLQPIATAANIAVDECDFGTALELGIDLFCSGHKELHMLINSLLRQAYTLLQRHQFVAIAKAHLEDRKFSTELSIFDLDKIDY